MILFECEGCNRPVEEHKHIVWYTFILYLPSQDIVDHLKYLLSCEHFVELQLYCSCNILTIFGEKLKFTKVCFVSKVFFDMNHNRIL